MLRVKAPVVKNLAGYHARDETPLVRPFSATGPQDLTPLWI